MSGWNAHETGLETTEDGPDLGFRMFLHGHNFGDEEQGEDLTFVAPTVPTEKLQEFEDETARQNGMQAAAERITVPAPAPQDVAGLVEGDLEWVVDFLNIWRKDPADSATPATKDWARAYNARTDRILAALHVYPLS